MHITSVCNRNARVIILVVSSILFNCLLFISSFSFAQDFSTKTLGDYGNITVMEVTGSYDAKNTDGTINSIPRQTITKEFLKTHKDEYDFVVIFTNFGFQMPDAEAKAFYLHVKNDVQGIGNPISDNSSLFGSNGKLQGIIDMGNIATVPVDPTDPAFEETLSILAHEQMHRWGAYVKFKDSHGTISTSLLGKDDSHWSYLLNSYGSVLYGNQWQDNGGGTFTSIATQKYYSPLDLYLMGFYDKTQVSPMLLIENPDIDPTKMPETGATITGTPRYITIDDIISAEGERIPGPSDAQRNFKTAFIFITAPGMFTGDELHGIENIRNGWVTRFSVLTDGKGITQVVSTLKDDIPVNPGIPLPPSTPRTLPPSIEDGVSWLMDNQSTDGSWIDVTQTTERDTSETVFALKNFPVAAQQYSMGLQWIGSDDSENTDYLSRKTESLTNSGRDASALIDQIASRQNPDGGWGCNRTYLSNPIDTSLALKALSAAGYSNQTVVSKAIEYLKYKENVDGGWGGDDEGSAVESTANALTSFSTYRTNYQIEDQITKGIAWLTQRQNTDGGFGNSPSTVYDSSLAVMALREFNVSSHITNNGLNYLLDQQSENGSWHESPYQTALAISAVWKATIDPDLSVKTEDITFIPTIIKSLPTTAVINITMWNAGRTDVSQAKVALYDGAVDEAKKIGEQIIAFPGQSSVTVTFPVSIPDGNEHRFYVSVDPENLVQESNESNNTVLKILYPQATYDLEILPSDLSVSQNPVDIFQDVKITSKITNKGTMNAYNVQVKYYIDEPGNPFDIATSTVDIPAGVTIVNEITWRTNKAGENLPVTVHVDPFNTFAEMSEENNMGVTALTVYGATDPNLTISYKDIMLTPHPANENGSVHISVIIRNEGFSPAINTVVKFYKGVPGLDGVLLGSQTIPIINPGESSQTELDWPNIAESGDRIISIKVDPDNLIGEIREDDNEAFTTLKILSLSDLSISANSIVFTPPAPKEGDIVSVNVTVKNSGEQAASDVPVRAYEGGAIIGSQIIPTIPGNSRASATFTYDTSGKSGARNITVILDPENVIIERSEDNNSASRAFGVQDANLWLTEQYISPNGDGVKDSTQFFFRLSTQQSVKVVVLDNKGQTVRTFGGSDFENSSGGNITWDGLDDNGMVVDDGQYQIKIIDGNNRALGSLLVVVDNNRSPLTDAIGTKHLLNTNLTCMLPPIGESNWQWFPDESGILFSLGYSEQSPPEYANGLYVMSPNGEDILRIVPMEWSRGVDPTYDYYFHDYVLSQDGEKIALLLNKYNKSNGMAEVNELWVVDSDGSNLTLIISQDLTQDQHSGINYIKWSPDGEYIIYMDENPTELWIMKPDGTGKTQIDPDGGYIDFSTVKWSPDSTNIAYICDTCIGWNCVPTVRISDVSGNRKVVFTLTDYGKYFEWLNATTIIASVPDEDSWWIEALWLIDTREEGNHKKISENPDEFRVSPDNNNIAFIEHDDTTISVKSSDNAGKTTILYDTSYVPLLGGEVNSNNVRNLTWAPDGRKLAFVNDAYGQMDACPSRSPAIKNYIPYSIVVDITNSSRKDIKVGEAACVTYDCMYSYPECYTPGAGRFGSLISFLPDNISILVEDNAYFLINSETGKRSNSLPIPGGNANSSPLGRYITSYYESIDQNSVCYGRGYQDLWALSSLLNLTADLRAVKEKSSVVLKGTAADLNFESNVLEYAETNTPDIWNLVSPSSDRPVIDDIFTVWIPPYEGTFYVRLTVRDKAGNVEIERRSISWGLSSSVTNLYKSREMFSPNNDGVNDTVELHYRALEPVHLEFTIYDSTNSVIRIIQRDYATPTEDFITWDGREGSGKFVPDGKYKIKVFDYDFFFEVDNTPPDVDIEISPLIETNETGGDGYFTGLIFYKVTISGAAYDKNFKNWIIEYSKGGNSQEWFKVYEGGEILAEKDEEGNPVFNPLKSDVIDFYAFTQVIPNDKPWNFFILNSIEDLVGNKYRITAEDFVGNKRTKIGNKLEERVKLISAGCDENAIFVLETIETQTKSLTLQYKYGQSNTWLDWANIPYPSLKETEHPEFQDIPQDASLRIKIVDVSDNEYYSDEIHRGCSNGENPPDSNKEIDFTLHIYNADADCGRLSDGKPVLSTRFTGLGQVSLLTQSYYIQKAEGLQLLRQFDLTKDGWGSVTIDTLNMSEGSYPVKVVLTYLDFGGNSIKEISAANTLIVDRVPPAARITYPATSLMLCPVTVPDSNGYWLGIPVEGVALDNSNVKRYELYYGIGDNPASWIPAMARVNGKPIPIFANGPKQGQLGVWDVTSLKGTEYSLKLKVVDVAGNAGCSATSFSVDELTEIGELTSDKSVFSPNGDEVLDDVKVNYQIDEYAIVDVKAFKLIQESSGTYIFDSSPVRTISSGLNHLGGEENATWDGKDDSGTPVPDGFYGIAVYVTDSCANANMRWVKVAVDNSPPSSVITYPRPPDPLGNVVEIKGTADDLHFQSYTLEAGEGDNPETWLLITSNTTPATDNILGTWNTFGLNGIWTLRLTASDTAGNKNETTVVIDLGVRKDLVKDLSATPRLFSPNNDGRLDTVNINYEFTDACQVQIDILDSIGAIRKTYTTTIPSAGTYSFLWDGKDNLNATVIDGAYTAKLSAALSSNPSVTHEEAVMIIVDSTLPMIDIRKPLNNSFLKGDIVINGTIVDKNILEYSITYSSDTGAALVDKANQNRENYTFGILDELAEGGYVIQVQAKDLGENSAAASIPFTIDRTPPKVTLDNPNEGEYYGSGKNAISAVGVITEKNLDGYSLRYGLGDTPSQWTELTSGNTIPDNPQLFTWQVGEADGIADGLYSMSLYAKDKAGASGEARVRITIDNTPPEVLITAPQDGGYVRAATEIKGTASDSNLVNYTLELSEGLCNSAFKWSAVRSASVSIKDGTFFSWQALPADGDYCFRLTAADKSGNSSETKVNVTVDTHPPAAPVLSGSLENKADAHLAWTQNTEQDFAGYHLYRDGQKANTTLMAGVDYLDENLTEGIYAYTVTAVDLAGNESQHSNEVRIKVDITGPDAKIRSPLDGSMVSGVIDIKGTAYSADDFRQYRVYIGQGQTPAAWNLIRTSPVPVSYGALTQWDTIGHSGLFSIKLEAEDLTGNINFHQITIAIDDTPPAPPVLISAIPDGSNVSLTWQAKTEPDLSGYLLYRNNQIANVSGVVIGDLKPYLLTGATYIDKNVTDGRHSYFLIAADQAGNLSDQSNVLEVNIDTSPPHAAIVEPPDKSKFQDTILMEAESPDTDIESVQFQYKRVQDSVWDNLGGAVTQSPYIVYLDFVSLGLPYGDYNLRAAATDQGGKTDPSPASITVTYTDMTSGDAPHDLKAATNGDDVALAWSSNGGSDLEGYNVYRKSGTPKSKINGSFITETSYQDQDLPDGVYTYEVTAVDMYGNESSPSNSASAKVYAPSIQQPYTPTGQQIMEIHGSNASANSTVELFNETLNGLSPAGSASADAEGNFILPQLALSLGENRITAKATDNDGNISRVADMVLVVYNEPPSAPLGFTGSVDDHSITLTWSPNPEPDLSGYNLYRNDEKMNGPVPVITGAVKASSSYYYNFPVRAFDSNASTYWMPAYSDDIFKPVWWEIDLLSPELITHLEIYWGSRNESGEEAVYAGKDFEIQVWSGYAWITHTKVTGNDNDANVIDLKPSYRTDKIRIFITDTTDLNYSKQVMLAEVKILKDNLITVASYDDLDLDDGEYRYNVAAVDYYGFESMPTEEAEADVGDVSPPSPPQNLTATASGPDVVLNWAPNSEPDLMGYNIFRNTAQGWVKINHSITTATAYSDANLLNGTYIYRVTAVDAAGNESLPSNEASANVSVPSPEPPVNLRVIPVPEGGALSAAWDYPGAAAGYNLYRSLTAGGPYTKIGSLLPGAFYFDSGLTNGTPYYYVITAVDSFGNESSHSNEATGIPSDVIFPAKPVLFFPAISENPVVLYHETTDISGFADPASVVELSGNDNYFGKTNALGNDLIKSLTMDENMYGIAVSPDGKTIAYEKNNVLWIKNLSAGDTVRIFEEGLSPVWSPDGNRIAYIYLDDNWNDRIAIYDLRTAENIHLTTDSAVYEHSPSWSFDGGKIAFTSSRGGSDDVWIKDLNADSITQASHSGHVSDAKLSPDGRKAAYSEEQNLYIVDLLARNTLLVDDSTDGYSFDWSPDSGRVLYVSYANSNGDIFVYDLDKDAKTQVAESINGVAYPTWSPDGKSIIFVQYGDDWTGSLWTTSSDAQDQRRLLPHNSYYLSDLSWLRTGGITYREPDNVLNILYLKGYFSFVDIQLEAGENIFSATATDFSGNRSVPSDEISVILDAGLLSDLEAAEDDVFIYPAMPQSGQNIAVDIIVWNRGQTEARDADVDIYIWDSSGSMELIKSGYFPSISPDSGETISFNWDTGDKTGITKIIAVIDPENTISERNETNNVVTKEFVVVDDEGIFIIANLNGEIFGSGQEMDIDATVINSGREINGTIDIVIEDENGNQVKTVDSSAAHIPYGSLEHRHVLWNTGSTYAGAYKVHAIISEGAQVIAENSAPFTISPDTDIDSFIVTDKISYSSYDDVLMTVAIRNSGKNYVIPSLHVKVTITDESNNAVFGEVKDIVNLLPGASQDILSIWNTGLSAAGNYRIVVEIFRSNELVLNRAASFSVKTSPVITGNMTVSPAVVMAGNAAGVEYTVQNTGNAAVNALGLNLLIIDPGTQTIMNAHEDIADLGVSSTKSGGFTFSTQGYSLKTYTALLQSVYQGNTKTIATASFTLKDGTPPVVTIISPVGGRYNSIISFAAFSVDDASGVVRVECTMDSGEWIPLPLSDPSAGRYSTTWAPTAADNGDHIISFRATDKAGNTSLPVSINITIQMNNTPPTGTISINNNDSYTNNADVTLILHATGSSGNAVSKMCISNTTSCAVWENYTETKAWILTPGDGTKTVYVWYQDSFGNANTAPYSAALTLDTTAPVLTVSTLSDGSWTNNTLLNVAGVVTDVSGLQQFTINGTDVTTAPDGSFSYPITLQEGQNALNVMATDPAGNNASDTRTINLDQDAPIITITAPADNMKTKQTPINVTGSVDDQSTVAVSVNDDTAVPAVMSDTDFSLAVALIYGINTIEVTATDFAGNTSTEKRTVTFNDRNPSLIVTEPAQDVKTNQTNMTVKGETSDLTAVTVTLTIDGNIYTPVVTDGKFEQPVTFTTEKIYEIYVMATNEVGNESTVQRNIVYDITSPAVTIDSVTSPTNLNSQTLTGAMEEGVTVSIISPSGTVGTVNYPSSTTWTVLVFDMQEGSNAITVTSTDEAGNISKPVSAVVMVDLSVPVVSISTPVSGGSYGARVAIGAVVTDTFSGVSSVEYQLDSGGWTSLPLAEPASDGYSTTWSPLMADEGTHSVSFRSVDKAGNMSVPVFAGFTIDLTPPPLPVISSPPDNSFVQSRIVDIRGVAEPGSLVTMVFAGNYTAKADAVTGEFIFEGIPMNPGINTLTFTAEDNTGNKSDQRNHTLRFDISEWFTGTLSVHPNPAYQGRDITFTYTIANSGDVDIPSVAVRVSVMKPDAQEVIKTLENLVSISKSSTLSGNITDSVDITPGIYAAVLFVSNDQMAQPKTLSIANFEIKTSLEAEKKLTDAVNLLVWINEDCHERKGMHTRCKDDHERCKWVDSAEELLRETVDSYSIVYDKKDFQAELRNPLYTDIFIMGNHRPLEDGYDDELREQVYSGKGLIASLFQKDGENRKDRDDDGPIFGVRYKGHLHGNDYDVDLVDSPVSAAGTVKTQGEALRVEAAEGTTIAGWIKAEKGKDGKCKAENSPAIALNDYGAGKTVYYAFDIGATLDSESYDQLSELLKNSIHYVHKVLQADSFAPYQGIPVEMNLNSSGSAFDFRITETYPLDVKIYDLSASRWITENPWIMTTHLEPDKAKSIRYIALPPDMTGTYTLETNIEYMENGSYIPYRNLKADFVIDRDAAAIISDILASLKGLQAEGRQRAKINDAIRHVEYIQKRILTNSRDIGKNITDILKAVDALISLNGIDVSAIRLQLDNLLRIWEGRYYLDSMK